MSLFSDSYFGGLSAFGGWVGGGFGIPISTIADSRMVLATPEQKAKPLDPTERPWTGIISLPGFYPGFDKAPPPSISLYWQMRRYSTIVLAQAITVGPVLAGARTIEIANDKGDKALAAQMQDLATQQVLPFIEQAMAPGFEALHFGFWLQEVIWDRKDGYTIPVEARSFLPGEATIMRDPCRRFIGYQIGNHYRDARYALLTVNNPHIDPIFGESRNEYCREEWWRARQSEENADKTERKAAGMQMGLGVPQGATFLDDRGNAIFPREMAEKLVNAAVRGDCFTYPLTAFGKQDCVRNPALMDIPAVKVTQYDWGNNGPALTAHLSRISAIDRKIMMARMRPSREAMEGTSGTRAEAGVHGQIGVTDSELVAAQQLSQITTQVLDRWAVTNFGAKAAGMLVAKQAPLSDPQQQFLQEVYKALCSGQKPDPETVAQIDRRALGKRVEMPLLDEKTVQATLASQQISAEPVSTGSSGQGDGETQSQYPALAAAHTTVLALAGELTGGRWVTINGVHVYIKDGVVVAGPARLLGKAQGQPNPFGEAPPTVDGGHPYEVCFAAGTSVAMWGGESKAIETVAADEWVMAVPDTDPRSEPRSYRVLSVFHNPPAQIWHVRVAGGIVHTTANHPFFVKDKGWIAVEKLKPGDQLRTIQGEWIPVEAVADSGVTEPVFNLQVEGANTYFVGQCDAVSAVLVHNSSVPANRQREDQHPISLKVWLDYVNPKTKKELEDALSQYLQYQEDCQRYGADLVKGPSFYKPLPLPSYAPPPPDNAPPSPNYVPDPNAQMMKADPRESWQIASDRKLQDAYNKRPEDRIGRERGYAEILERREENARQQREWDAKGYNEAQRLGSWAIDLWNPYRANPSGWDALAVLAGGARDPGIAARTDRELTGAGNTASLNRPYIRQATRQAVEAAAPRTADGRPIDPNTRLPINGTPDLGHKTGQEFWREKEKAEAEGLAQQQFNDRMNDPKKYQLEDPSSNRSHKYEQP